MFVTALFAVVIIWKQPKCLLRDEWIRVGATNIQWNTTQS